MSPPPRPPLLHHVSLPVGDLDRAGVMYDAALTALGYRRVFANAAAIGYGLDDGKDKLMLKLERPARAAGPGFHLALSAPSPAAVDGFHARAVAAGATDNGGPGRRPHYGDDYYAAFVIDADGNRLEAVYKSADWPGGNRQAD